MTTSATDTALTLRTPTLSDGAEICELVANTKPLDPNSCYTYLLLSTHFADTCVVAEDEDGIVGFISAYRPPKAHDVLFVWQVAVKSTARGRGIATAMLNELVARENCEDVAYLEATVTPSNAPSQGLFRALAKAHNAPCEEVCWFPPESFSAGAAEEHEAEILFRIGPLQPR